MRIKDIYPLMENLHKLRGVNLIEDDSVVMFTREALGICYLEYSNKIIKSFTYTENDYFDIYI